MVCEDYETCGLINRTPFEMLTLYKARYCEGGNDAVAECQYRLKIKEVKCLEKQLEAKKKTIRNITKNAF